MLYTWRLPRTWRSFRAADRNNQQTRRKELACNFTASQLHQVTLQTWMPSDIDAYFRGDILKMPEGTSSEDCHLTESTERKPACNSKLDSFIWKAHTESSTSQVDCVLQHPKETDDTLPHNNFTMGGLPASRAREQRSRGIKNSSLEQAANAQNHHTKLYNTLTKLSSCGGTRCLSPSGSEPSTPRHNQTRTNVKKCCVARSRTPSPTEHKKPRRRRTHHTETYNQTGCGATITTSYHHHGTKKSGNSAGSMRSHSTAPCKATEGSLDGEAPSKTRQDHKNNADKHTLCNAVEPIAPYLSGDRRPHEHCSKEPRYPPVAFCAQVVQPLCSSSRTFRISAEAVVHNSVAQVAPAQPLKSDCLAAHCSIDSLVPISSSYTADDSITNTLCRRESETNEIRLIPHWSLLSP